MKLYKLTSEDFETCNHTKWGIGVTHTAVGLGIELCSEDVIHAYEHPCVAVLMNGSHSDFDDPVLWEAEGTVVVREGPLKCGVKSLTTLRIIDLPRLTKDQRLEITIRCTLTLEQPEYYKAWAYDWLNGTDRTQKSARAITANLRESYEIRSLSPKLYGTAISAYYAAAYCAAFTYSYYDVSPVIEHSYNVNTGLDLIGIINEVVNTKKETT